MRRSLLLLLPILACSKESEHAWFRSIGGISNNPIHLTWGTAHMALPRRTSADYADGVGKPSGPLRPSPRTISNRLFAQARRDADVGRLSGWAWQWGQFVSHDLSLTEPLAKTPDTYPIPIPVGDPYFDPQALGNQTMPFIRSVFHSQTGTRPGNPRQQINQVTSFLDASHVYGSDSTREQRLRLSPLGDASKDRSAFLISSNDTNQDGEYLLPRNIFASTNCNYGHPQPEHLFLSGDVRANEVPGLIVLHTVFMREHNRLVRELSMRFPKATHDYLFEYARKLVGAEMQAITYGEFLPALLGGHAVSFGGYYDPDIDPSVSNEFSTVLFRFGHSMIPGALVRVEPDTLKVTSQPLWEVFFAPNSVSRSGDLDAIAWGLAIQPSEKVDLKIVNPLRNFLFQGTLGHGLDLVAMNIQRGRDHGIVDYNSLRVALGLSRVTDFSEITRDVQVQRDLFELYGSVDNIDAWVGALAEDHLPGASLGPSMVYGMQDAFRRLRDGDRFWFERDPLLTAEEIDALRATRLSDVIRRNTGASDLPYDLLHVSNLH